jgi:hypothetical protein
VTQDSGLKPQSRDLFFVFHSQTYLIKWFRFASPPLTHWSDFRTNFDDCAFLSCFSEASINHKTAMGLTYQKHRLVPDQWLADFDRRCSEQLAILGVPAEKVNGKPLSIFGSRFLAARTKAAYTYRLRKFVSFLMKEGCYDDSLLVFSHLCPKGLLPCSDRVVSNFLLSCFAEKGMPFEEIDSDAVQPTFVRNAKKDIDMQAIGDWHDHLICDSFRSALNHVHIVQGLSSDYCERCDDCHRAFYHKDKTDPNRLKCHVHELQLPRIKRGGNPCNSLLVKNTIDKIKQESRHVVRGAEQLDPAEQRAIRDYCVSSNSPFLLMFYVLMRFATNLYLRRFEFESLHEDNFNTALFVMLGAYIIGGLNLKVFGKRKRRGKNRLAPGEDPVWRHLYLWADDICPDLDVPRHLLAFLYAINWKGGYLFPSEKELNNPPADGVYKTFMTEETLISTLKHIYNTVLKRDSKLGSHVFRKSGYLHGRLGGASFEEMMVGASHDTAESAARYMMDADSVAVINDMMKDPLQAVCRWKSPHCRGTVTTARFCMPGRKWQKPLKELVVGFFEEAIKIDLTHPSRRHPKWLVDQAMAYRKPNDAQSELSNHLREIGADRGANINLCVQRIVQDVREEEKIQFEKKVKKEADNQTATHLEQLKEHLASKGLSQEQIMAVDLDGFLTTIRDGRLPEAKRTLDDPESDNPVPKRLKKTQKRSGEKEIDKAERDQGTKGDPAARLAYLCQFAGQSATDYVNKDRLWLIRILPIAKCFMVCCGGSVEDFLERNGNKTIANGKNTSFSIEICNKKRKSSKHCTCGETLMLDTA